MTQHPNPTILPGNVITLARQLAAQDRPPRVHCIVTSPPYYGLRDYGTDPQIWDDDPACQHEWTTFTRKGQSGGTASAKVQTKGTENFQIVPDSEQATCAKCGAWRGELGQEPSPDLFIKHLVDIFQALKPLLHPSGVLFVNLGDTYNNFRVTGYPPQSVHNGHLRGKNPSKRRGHEGLKEKDLMGIPWMFAFAMREAGWYLRSEIIWAKKNPMPESVTDRPTKAHETIFLFSKEQHYFFDHIAAREASQSGPSDIKKMVQGLARIGGKHLTETDLKLAASQKTNIGRQRAVGSPAGRNMRSVQWGNSTADLERWLKAQPEFGALVERYLAEASHTTVYDVPTAPYPGAHFATWPARLADRMIRAGTSEKGVCPACLAPWERILADGPVVVEGDSYPKTQERPEHDAQRRLHANLKAARAAGAEHSQEFQAPETIGWKPTCTCNQDDLRLAEDDLEIIETPTGERAGADPSLITGRAGMNRPRAANEGTVPMQRHQQRRYAVQLKASPYRAEMEAAAGPAFAHYLRTDRAGARPIPPDLLADWLGRGWVTEEPPLVFTPWEPVPATVLDPFTGSGTTLAVARKLGRQSLGFELNQEYVELAYRRLEMPFESEEPDEPDPEPEDLSDLPLFAGVSQ